LKQAHNLQGLGEVESELTFSMTDQDLSVIDRRLLNSDEFVSGFAEFCRAVRNDYSEKRQEMRQQLIEKNK
jgi:hypothetical protein